MRPQFTKAILFGQSAIRRLTSDTSDLLTITDENSAVLARWDWRARRRVSTTPTALPSVSAGADLGSGGTVTITGDDTAGRVTITCGTGTIGPHLATVTFSGVWGNPPFVILTAGDTGAAALGVFAGKSTSAFSIRVSGTPTTSTTYSWDYHAVGA